MKIYESIERLKRMKENGLNLDELKQVAINTAETARTSYEKKQAGVFLRDIISTEKKWAARDYKNFRDVHPMNSRKNRRVWGSQYITAPNYAGLYIERITGYGINGADYNYMLRQIAKDSRQKIEGAVYPYINTIPNTDGTGLTAFRTEWDARQALRLFTAAFDAAAVRELYAWYNAHTVTACNDTPGLVRFYADKYSFSADVDTDPKRNRQGARLWTN